MCTQLGHFHAVMGQVPLTGNPTLSFEVQYKDYGMKEELSIGFS